MSIDLYNQSAYGLTQPVFNVFPQPIVALRDPTSADKAMVGRIWVKTSATPSSNAIYILASNANNNSVWVSVASGGGAGNFTTLLVTGASTFQGQSAFQNSVMITGASHNLTVGSGNIITSTGNINSGGSITAANGLLVQSGNVDIQGPNSQVNITDGNLTITDVSMGNGNIIAAGSISCGDGDIEAQGGNVLAAGSLIAAGDSPATSTNVAVTGQTQTASGSGALTLLAIGSSTPHTNTGFLKIYVGSSVRWIPYFDQTIE